MEKSMEPFILLPLKYLSLVLAAAGVQREADAGKLPLNSVLYANQCNYL